MKTPPKAPQLLINVSAASFKYKLGWYLWAFLVIHPLNLFLTALYYPIIASTIIRASDAANLQLPISFSQLVGIGFVLNLLVYPSKQGLSDAMVEIKNIDTFERGFCLSPTKSTRFAITVSGKVCNFIGLGILWLIIPYVVKFALWAGN